MKTIHLYQCGKCADGTVKVIRTETRSTIAYDFKKCDKCKAFYGLSRISSLDPKAPSKP